MHSMTATRHSYAYYIVPVMLGDVLGVVETFFQT